MWGILLIVPFVSKCLSPLFGFSSSGYSILAAGIVLAVMILPTIVNISVEVLSSVPAELKEAALSLGATKFEVIYHVVLKKARAGLIAACTLGLSRAFGETIAVMMVVGNVPQIPNSLFHPLILCRPCWPITMGKCFPSPAMYPLLISHLFLYFLSFLFSAYYRGFILTR
jgi:ABC-type phosphate transport system, permease component